MFRLTCCLLLGLCGASGLTAAPARAQDAPPAVDASRPSREISPNEFTGSDSERINQAIQAASRSGSRVRVPRNNAQRDDDIWLLDTAILVCSNTVLELDQCHLKLSDKCRDNFIRSGNCGLGISDIQPISHVSICGIGQVLLEGADHPRATGDSAKQLGQRTYGTDAGRAAVSQTGDWRNIGILLAQVDHFRIENLTIKDSHCWAISLERCSFGRIADVHFESAGSKLIDGRRETILNQDGIDLRQGCHDIHIERISGRTGDDLIALTNIATRAGGAGSDDSTMVSAEAPGPNQDDDVRNIFLRNIAGHSAGRHHVVRILNASGLRIYNVVLDGLLDTSPADAPCKATVKIGDANPAWGGVTPSGDTNRLALSNITSTSQHTILIAGSLTDSVISNVVRYSDQGDVITYASGRENVRNVCLHNLVARRAARSPQPIE